MKHISAEEFDDIIKSSYSEDVYDLDEECRISIESMGRYSRSEWDTVGVDQLTPVDSAIHMNGNTVFVTEY